MLKIKQFFILIIFAIYIGYMLYYAHKIGNVWNYIVSGLLILFLILQTANYIVEAILKVLDEFIEELRRK